MDVMAMSHHHPGIRFAVPYVAALPLPTLDRLLLTMVVDACLSGRTWQPRGARWGELVHRRRETVSRAVGRLQRLGYLRVIRRGRKLSNVYRLSRSLWNRLVSGRRAVGPAMLRHLLDRLFGGPAVATWLKDGVRDGVPDARTCLASASRGSAAAST